MSEMFRDCPDCGSQQEFTQLHAGQCPDSASDQCPEWMCTACGCALLVILLPPVREIAGSGAGRAERHLDRVA